MRLLLLLCLGCGAATSSFVEPVLIATEEACYQLGKRAIDKAETREEAAEDVADIERRCELAFDGIRVAGEIVEEARDE